MSTYIKVIASAVMAMGLTAVPAHAQNYGDRIQLAQRGDDRRDDRRDGNRGRDERRADRHDERGAGPEHRWHRGDRLPAEYNHRHYVVDDWRGHHLSAPPRGYHWVQTGGDYVLAAVATGIIADLLINSN